MKTFGNLLMVLFCLLFLQGTAVAVLGVADDVPGQDVVFPIICGVNASAPLNTSWAIAEVVGGTPDLSGNVAHAAVILFNTRSQAVHDYTNVWTKFDVVTDDCKTLINTLSASSKNMLQTTINGVAYYVGYLNFLQEPAGENPLANRFVGWVSVDDQLTGTGFKPFQAEGGIGPNFEEDGVPVNAKTFFFRFAIDNNVSYNWWIILSRIQSETNPGLTRTVQLQGFICNETEDCVSVVIPLPNELNIINVASYLPGAPLFAGYPKRGFAMLDLVVHDVTLSAQTTYTPSNVSTFAWSYLHNCTQPFFNPIFKSSLCLRAKASMYPADRLYFENIIGILPGLPQ